MKKLIPEDPLATVQKKILNLQRIHRAGSAHPFSEAALDLLKELETLSNQNGFEPLIALRKKYIHTPVLCREKNITQNKEIQSFREIFKLVPKVCKNKDLEEPAHEDPTLGEQNDSLLKVKNKILNLKKLHNTTSAAPFSKAALDFLEELEALLNQNGLEPLIALREKYINVVGICLNKNISEEKEIQSFKDIFYSVPNPSKNKDLEELTHEDPEACLALGEKDNKLLQIKKKIIKLKLNHGAASAAPFSAMALDFLEELEALLNQNGLEPLIALREKYINVPGICKKKHIAAEKEIQVIKDIFRLVLKPSKNKVKARTHEDLETYIRLEKQDGKPLKSLKNKIKKLILEHRPDSTNPFSEAALDLLQKFEDLLNKNGLESLTALWNKTTVPEICKANHIEAKNEIGTIQNLFTRFVPNPNALSAKIKDKLKQLEEFEPNTLIKLSKENKLQKLATNLGMETQEEPSSSYNKSSKISKEENDKKLDNNLDFDTSHKLPENLVSQIEVNTKILNKKHNLNNSSEALKVKIERSLKDHNPQSMDPFSTNALTLLHQLKEILDQEGLEGLTKFWSENTSVPKLCTSRGLNQKETQNIKNLFKLVPCPKPLSLSEESSDKIQQLKNLGSSVLFQLLKENNGSIPKLAQMKGFKKKEEISAIQTIFQELNSNLEKIKKTATIRFLPDQDLGPNQEQNEGQSVFENDRKVIKREPDFKFFNKNQSNNPSRMEEEEQKDQGLMAYPKLFIPFAVRPLQPNLNQSVDTNILLGLALGDFNYQPISINSELKPKNDLYQLLTHYQGFFQEKSPQETADNTDNNSRQDKIGLENKI